MMTFRMLLCLMLLLRSSGKAQPPAYTFSAGLAADLAGKMALAAHNINSRSFPLAGSLTGYAALQGTGYRALGFLGQAGLHFDHIRYRLDRSSFIGYTPYHVLLSGTILFPTVHPKLDICAGISFRYFLGAGLNRNQNPPHVIYTGFRDDSARKLLTSAERKLLPGIHWGIRYRLSEKSPWQAYAQVSHQLLSEFDGDATLRYTMNGSRIEQPVNHQPTFIRVGAMLRL